MKIQGLAIIFVILILPITIIIGEYASAQIEIFRVEQLYDSRLITATHDALKAFQINTFNDAASDIVDSKISSIEASANAFYNSMESSFGLQGYSKEELQKYVPALVYTMYDGYYIYSPYANIADISSGDGLNIILDSNNMQYGFKPYVYYSCRYDKMNAQSDFIINYALDNYITVQGIVNGESVYKSGYLVTIADSQIGEGVYKKTLLNGLEEYYYSGQQILPEASLSENLVEKDVITGEVTTKEYKYIKLNGTKYYWDEDEEYIFYLMGGNRVKQVTNATDENLYMQYVNEIKTNSSAIQYYKSAYEFTTWVNDNLGNLQAQHAETAVHNSGNGKIFKNEQIEYSGSNFNSHRKEVIRYSIESNLSVAIANFNNYTSTSTNFQMPKLKETEWELLENEISIISFLQGINIGGKIYNGYTVVTNDKTEEVVKEERIYIATNDGYYHKINDEHFEDEYEANTVKRGVLDLDFEIRKDGATGASYTNRNELGCYTSIVGQEKVNNKYDSIYEYLKRTDIDKKIKQTYYIALGRERWGTYKVENPSNIGNILNDMVVSKDPIVVDGLIRYYDADNNTGSGHSNSTTTWKDLSGHYDAAINGGATFSKNDLHLDGTNDWVNCGVIDVDYITISAKIKLNDISSDRYYLICNWETDTSGVGFFIDDWKLYFRLYDETGKSQGVDSQIKLEKNRLYDVTGTYDGNQAKLYIDGICVATKQYNGKIIGPTQNTVLSIGVNTRGSIPDSWSPYVDMNVHSVMVYERALTEEEIKQNIAATKKEDEQKNYTVIYNGVPGTGHPTKVDANANLVVNTTLQRIERLQVTMNGIPLNQDTDYTYNPTSKQLIIKNVTGDLILEYQDKVYLADLSFGVAYFKELPYRTTIKNISFVDYVDTTNAVKTYDLSESKDGTITGWITDNGDRTYNLYIGSIYDIYSKTLSHAFALMSGVNNITFNNLNTSETTSMENMFYGCTKLNNLNLGSFDTSNVYTMANMFSDCTLLRTLYLQNASFNTVTNYTNMFLNVQSIGVFVKDDQAMAWMQARLGYRGTVLIFVDR